MKRCEGAGWVVVGAAVCNAPQSDPAEGDKTHPALLAKLTERADCFLLFWGGWFHWAMNRGGGGWMGRGVQHGPIGPEEMGRMSMRCRRSNGPADREGGVAVEHLSVASGSEQPSNA